MKFETFPSQHKAAATVKGWRLGLLAAVMTTVVSHAVEPVVVSGRAMGTTWSVKFIRSLAGPAPTLVERAVAERLEQLEQLFSTYRPQSALSLFNATQGTEWIPAAAELVHVAEASRRISEQTDGAFDVTVFPLVELWGFGATRRTATIPTPNEIAMARARVDWRRLEMRTSPPALRKTEASLAVDFASMAKGFSADEISHLLVRIGALNHLVQIGGDVKAAGGGPEDKGWRVAIENPPDMRAASTQVVTLRDAALSTSGDYRNTFVVEGRRYGHIIDPRRGEPVRGDLAAVSVVRASCAESSAWATALFVVGSASAERIAEKQEIAARLLVRDGAATAVRTTSRFDSLGR